jgi:hypothetical protein
VKTVGEGRQNGRESPLCEDLSTLGIAEFCRTDRFEPAIAVARGKEFSLEKSNFSCFHRGQRRKRRLVRQKEIPKGIRIVIDVENQL